MVQPGFDDYAANSGLLLSHRTAWLYVTERTAILLWEISEAWRVDKGGYHANSTAKTSNLRGTGSSDCRGRRVGRRVRLTFCTLLGKVQNVSLTPFGSTKRILYFAW